MSYSAAQNTIVFLYCQGTTQAPALVHATGVTSYAMECLHAMQAHNRYSTAALSNQFILTGKATLPCPICESRGRVYVDNEYECYAERCKACSGTGDIAREEWLENYA